MIGEHHNQIDATDQRFLEGRLTTRSIEASRGDVPVSNGPGSPSLSPFAGAFSLRRRPDAGVSSHALASTHQQIRQAFTERNACVDAGPVGDLVQARRASKLPSHLTVSPCSDPELNCERPGALPHVAAVNRPHDAPSLARPACLTSGNMTDRGLAVAFQRKTLMNRIA